MDMYELPPSQLHKRNAGLGGEEVSLNFISSTHVHVEMDLEKVQKMYKKRSENCPTID